MGESIPFKNHSMVQPIHHLGNSAELIPPMQAHATKQEVYPRHVAGTTTRIAMAGRSVTGTYTSTTVVDDVTPPAPEHCYASIRQHLPE